LVQRRGLVVCLST